MSPRLYLACFSVAMLQACVTPISFDTGKALDKGETRFQVGFTGGGGDKVLLTTRSTPSEDGGDPVETTVDYPPTKSYGAYALGARHGFGGGFELQGAAEMWTPAGIGGSLALKFQVLGGKRSVWAAAIKVRGGFAGAGAGGGDDAAGIIIGQGEVGVPVSFHPTDGPGALYAVPRAGLLVFHHEHPDGNTTEEMLGLGLTLGLLMDLDSVWIPIEVTAIRVPPHGGLDESATQIAISIGLLLGDGDDDPDELRPPWE